jgi:transcriptional regulator with XRE-family HTH domain
MNEMNGQELLEARKQKYWEQIETAEKLGVSQTYLSLLETGKRPVTKQIARKAVKIFGLSAEALPILSSLENLRIAANNDLARDLSALGYPPLAHIKARHKRNPAEVLLSALRSDNLDSRIVEALPWVVFNFPQMDWDSVIRAAKINDLQNRLGFIVELAEKLASISKNSAKLNILHEKKVALSKSRLLHEDTLCQNSITDAEKNWLKTNRSKEARFWRLLSDLTIKNLNYA